MTLLDLYRHRFGNAVKRQGNGWNGPCPLCGGQPGKSDRFVVWDEKDEGLGQTCAEYGIKGIWSCRQCGASGDTIAYLMQCENMDFKAALSELGIEGGRPTHRRRHAPQEPRGDARSFQPRECPEPSDTWKAYAAKLVAAAEQEIWRQPQALRWLAARGIDEAAVRAYRIGYLTPEPGKYPGRWRARTALGLPVKKDDNGRERNKIFIPRGIVIPTLAQDGSVTNIRIRRHREDLREHSPKYLELEGSSHAPLLLRALGAPALAAYFVVEAELDAMLIHHTMGGTVGALAVRTNRGKPDVAAHRLLKEALCVGVALDYDHAGAEGVAFWSLTYPKATRWPTPEGKDPGDAYKLGVNIRAWIEAALPGSVATQKNCSTTPSLERGHVDSCAPGEKIEGEGGASIRQDALSPQTAQPQKVSVHAPRQSVRAYRPHPRNYDAYGRPQDRLIYTPLGPADSLRVLAGLGLTVEPAYVEGQPDFLLHGHERWPMRDIQQLMTWTHKWGHFVVAALHGDSNGSAA